MQPDCKTTTWGHLYGKGISRDGEIVDLGVKFGIIQKSGAWFSYGDMRLAQGRDNTREMLVNDPALFKEINDKVVEALREASSASKVKKAKPEAPVAPAPQPTTKASARAKLDIVVDDDD